MSWVLVALFAAAAQTGRNAAQAGMAGRLGTIPATATRFFFGLPFAVLGLWIISGGNPLPRPDGAVLAWAAIGAGAQIGATALLLLAVAGRGFGVATALTKTEPITLAIIGAVLLAEPLGAERMGAIILASIGVLMASGAEWSRAALRAAVIGVASGALFGLSAVGFRGAIIALPEGGPLLRASVVLAISLTMQSAALLAWLALRQPAALRAIAREWRGSIAAGGLGWLASQLWFLGFALTSPANIRTVALAEIFFAQLLSGRMFRERARPVQLAGMGLIAAGVIWLIAIAR